VEYNENFKGLKFWGKGGMLYLWEELGVRRFDGERRIYLIRVELKNRNEWKRS